MFIFQKVGGGHKSFTCDISCFSKFFIRFSINLNICCVPSFICKCTCRLNLIFWHLKSSIWSYQIIVFNLKFEMFVGVFNSKNKKCLKEYNYLCLWFMFNVKPVGTNIVLSLLVSVMCWWQLPNLPFIIVLLNLIKFLCCIYTNKVAFSKVIWILRVVTKIRHVVMELTFVCLDYWYIFFFCSGKWVKWYFNFSNFFHRFFLGCFFLYV